MQQVRDDQTNACGGHVNSVTSKAFAKTSFFKYKNLTNITRVEKTKSKPDAREEAHTSVRNFAVEFAVTHALMHPYPENPKWTICPSLIKAFDPVPIPINGGNPSAGYMTSEARAMGLKNVRVGTEPRVFGTLGFGLLGADGTSDFVVAIKDPTRKVPVRIPLLGLGANSHSTGEIWIVKGFHGADGVALFDLLIKELVLPSFVKSFALLKQFPRSTDDTYEERGIFSNDGQDEELKAIELNLLGFRELKVDAMKHSSGTSAWTQPNDAYKLHTVIHKGANDGIYKDETDYNLVSAAAVVIQAAKDKHKFSKDIAAKVITAYTVLQPVLARACAPHIIKKSFQISGAFDMTTGDVNKKTMLGQCKTVQQMDQDQVDEVMLQVDALCALGNKGFLLTEQTMNDLNMFQTEKEKNRADSLTKVQKNELCLNKQRTCVLTHAGFEAYQQEKKKSREKQEKQSKKRLEPRMKKRNKKKTNKNESLPALESANPKKKKYVMTGSVTHARPGGAHGRKEGLGRHS